MRHPRAQPVLAYPARAAIFLVLTARPGGQAQVTETLAELGTITRSVASRGLSCVAGIGAELWDRLWPGRRPVGLEPLREVAGPEHTAVATPGDLLFHLRADRLATCSELAYRLLGGLSDAVEVADLVSGMRHLDDRDLPRLTDGIDNPAGIDAVSAVQVGAEDPDHAGGSYVLVQKYLHDLDAWHALPVVEQRRLAGLQPAGRTAELARRTVRDTVPFGTVGDGEFGSYVVAYASTAGILEQLLRDRFGGDPPGPADRVLDFSTAVTGGLFFVPTTDQLRGPGGRPSGAATRLAAVARTAGPRTYQSSG